MYKMFPPQKLKLSSMQTRDLDINTSLLNQAPYRPHLTATPLCVISLSSALPGQGTSPRHTARTVAIAHTNHIITISRVKALHTPLIPGLEKTAPTWIAANVSPALGKTNAHQLRVNDILRRPATTATVLMQKNQKAKMTMKMPAIIPSALTMLPSESVERPKTLGGKILGAFLPSWMSAAEV